MKNYDPDFSKKLRALVLPIALQNFMFAAVGASDALMLGMLNQDSIAAVSLASQIQFVHSLFLAALVIGTTMLVAQYWGKGDTLSIEKIFANVIKVSILISFLFFIAVSVKPDILMRIFTTDITLINIGANYLRVVGISYLLTGISQIYLCIMKNSGQALKSTMVSSVTVLLNIFLNAVLIFGLLGIPKMGVVGAALATVIARVIELLWVIIESGRKHRIGLKWKYIYNSDKALSKDFWRYASPVLGNELVWGGGFTMYSVIMGHLGSDAIVANAIANIAKNLIACICLGIAGGGGIIVGNELGKGALIKAKEYGDRLGKIAITTGIVSGMILLASIPLIMRFVLLTEDANGYLLGMLVMCSYYLIGKSVNATVIAGIFCAGGDSRFGFICDAITMWLITVPLGCIAAFYLKLPVLIVYFILNLDEIIKLPAVYKHYKKYKWVKDLTIKTLP